MYSEPRKRNVNRPEKVKISEILNFTSAIIAVVASAIFYFAGWVYLSHWYSFFGIDATELNLSPQIVLLHGIPGVLIIILTGILTASIFAIVKLAVKKAAVSGEDFPSLIMSTYTISIIVLIAIISASRSATTNGVSQNEIQIFNSLPLEVRISAIGVIIIGLFFSLTDRPLLILLGKNVSGTTMIGLFPRRNYIRDYVWIRTVIGYVRKNGIDEKILHDLDSVIGNLDEREKEFLQSFAEQQSNLQKAAGQTWQFWAGAFIILYFLVSISVSSILGEWDAKAGRKSMIGGWRAEATYIYSDKNNLPLPLYQPKSDTQLTNIYGPMIVLGKNEDNYYLTDWVDAFPITSKPNVYVIKINENMALGMQMVAPTPTLLVTQHPAETATPTTLPTTAAVTQIP